MAYLSPYLFVVESKYKADGLLANLGPGSIVKKLNIEPERQALASSRVAGKFSRCQTSEF